MDFDIVFLTPEKFDDTRQIVEHIKKDRIVHINMTKLNPKDCQRALDYVSGAAYIQDANLRNPGEAIYCTIPSGKNYLEEGVKVSEGNHLMDLRYDEEEEIKPTYG